jgi:hypothetical protein
LQAVAAAFAVEAPPGDAAQFLMHEWHERVQSRLVAAAPLMQQPGDVVNAYAGGILPGF